MGNCLKITKAHCSTSKCNKDEAGKSTKVVFVIGGPGSGKGTQCEKIREAYFMSHISTGDLMRDEVASGSERGKHLKEIMEKGELVPLDTVLELLKDALKKSAGEKKHGCLVDGFPREVEQASRFEKEVAECLCVLYFELSEEVMKQRLLKRGESSGRVDDNEETIKKRLETFRNNTEPILKYFEEKGKLCRIDASHDIETVYGKVQEALSGKLEKVK